MKKMKLLLVAASLLGVSALASCGGASSDITLTVYNAEDYIYEGVDEDGNPIEGETSVIEGFEKYYEEKYGKTITVNYQTFSTLEEMHAKVANGSIKADLVCPSDYMIQRLADEGLIQSLGFNKTTKKYGDDLANYNEYLSPYLKNLFDENDFSDYAVPYFWGTMGYTYNPARISEEAVSTWEFQWNPVDIEGKALGKADITVKESVRDTYFTAVMHVYKTELDTLRTRFEAGEITAEAYNTQLSEIFNRHDEETLNKAKTALLELKKKASLEVDEGKQEMVTGAKVANLAWSGDAVFAMDEAEKAGVILNYSLPEEGSNVWFDGWCLTKNAQVEPAKEFLNYLANPEIGAKNMEATGYTSPLACDSIWELVNDWYAAEEGETEVDTVDLSYYFGENLTSGEAKINIAKENRGRQFDAQYPEESVINRCAIMKDFGTEGNDKLNEIWSAFLAD